MPDDAQRQHRAVRRVAFGNGMLPSRIKPIIVTRASRPCVRRTTEETCVVQIILSNTHPARAGRPCHDGGFWNRFQTVEVQDIREMEHYPTMRTDELDFDLPPELIAQEPPGVRSASR